MNVQIAAQADRAVDDGRHVIVELKSSARKSSTVAGR